MLTHINYSFTVRLKKLSSIKHCIFIQFIVLQIEETGLDSGNRSRAAFNPDRGFLRAFLSPMSYYGFYLMLKTPHDYLTRIQTFINNNIRQEPRTEQMKLIESFLGFKAKKSTILEQRNSIFKLLILLNIPNIIFIFLFSREVPEPYMDEEFHYRQFLSYYANDYSAWDPKITTPPGTYYVQRLFSFVIGKELWALRALNCLVFSNLFAVFTMKIYEFQDHNRNNLTRSLNLAITPTIFFFNFLDYTDTISLAFITMAFYYNLVGSSWRMGLFSLMSIFIRQNNIIWAAYFLVYRIVGKYSASMTSIRGNIFRSIISFFKILFNNRVQIITQNFVQILIFPIFLWYIYRYNGGSLLFGDHSNHVPGFHPTQLLYLSLFVVINIPITLTDFVENIKSCYSRMYYSRHALAFYLFLLSACLIIVDKFSIVHPFILSDNRHYIFYIYRYFKWAKYPLCFLYPFCIIFIARIIVQSQEKFIKYILWVCTSLVYLMLSSLVEFRYFTIPLVIISFEIRNRSLSFDVEKVHGIKAPAQSQFNANRMIFSILAKAAVNALTFWIFLYRPFGADGKSRFMW